MSIASGTTLTVLDKGSLVQVNDAGTNTINGTFNMTRLADIRKYDYVFWSSPVLNFPLTTLSSGTNSAYVWNWNTTVVNPNGGFGNWENTLENMVTGKGYIVRGSDTFSNATTQTFTANFTGTPHNGVYTPTISRENYQGVNYLGTNLATITNNDDNWNLVGNPYPSAIKAMDFITVNTNIDGNVRLWTHGTLPSSAITSPYYNSYTNNYSPNDYIVYNGTATTSGPTGFNGYIAAGQSFLVLMNDGAATTETVTFNNSMRKTTNNDQFYKQSNLKNNLERHRIWLDLVSSTGVANRTVVGYIEGATQQKDRLFDAYTNIGGTQDFYSLIDNKTMVIQGRALPFSPDDMVPMGIVVPNNGTYTISIANVDGLFATNFQNIYLEDKQLNIIYDLKTAPYSFTANAGTFNNRFQLRYTNTKLKNTEFNSTDNQVVITSNNQEILIISAIEKISSVSVFDVLGRKILSLENINDTNARIEKSKFATEVLVLKIKLENGEVITKKVL